jgi:peptidoglycan/xylan/chitin deacetylase (PgdA/CDA1 family)
MNRRSAILTYHSLDDSGSVISVAPEVFRRQMEWLAVAGIPVVPLEDIRKTPGAVALTFDDGFANLFEHALPVLARHGFPSTVFVVSGRCGHRNRWEQTVKGIPDLDLMGWSELASAAAAGVSVGAHTVTHPFLTALREGDLERELALCRATIEDRIGRPVESFAYPYGHADARVRAAAGRHFRLACGTRLAFVREDSDLLELPRIDVFYVRRRRWFETLQQPGGAAYIAARRWIRELPRGRAASASHPAA